MHPCYPRPPRRRRQTLSSIPAGSPCSAKLFQRSSLTGLLYGLPSESGVRINMPRARRPTQSTSCSVSKRKVGDPDVMRSGVLMSFTASQSWVGVPRICIPAVSMAVRTESPSLSVTQPVSDGREATGARSCRFSQPVAIRNAAIAHDHGARLDRCMMSTVGRLWCVLPYNA